MLGTAPNRIPIDKFVADLRKVCGQFDVRHENSRGLIAGGIALENRAGFEFALVRTSIQQIIRSHENIRSDSGENYFLILQKEGQALMCQDDRSVVLNPGEMVLIDSARPSEFTFFGAYNYQLSLHLPRAEMEARFGADLMRGGLSLSRDNPTNMAIQGVLGTLFGQTQMNGSTQSCLREALMGLIGAMLYDQSGRENFLRIETDPGQVRAWSQATAYIDANYRNPDFSLQDMASDLGWSLRQIQRAFVSTGNAMTPSKYILIKRLEHARRELNARKAGLRHDHISSIAYEAGFSDLSYFYRCFRKTFGKTPKAYLSAKGQLWH